MMARIAVGLFVHFCACVAYVVLNYYGVSLYKYLFGGLTSRGASIGIAMYMVFYLFIAVNLFVSLVPKAAVKWGALMIMVALILIYLLPDYPVRAFAYGVLSGSLTALAILVASKVNNSLLQRIAKRGDEK